MYITVLGFGQKLKKTCQGPSPRIYIKLCYLIVERNHKYVIKKLPKKIMDGGKERGKGRD